MEDLGKSKKESQNEYATQLFEHPPESMIDTLIGDVTDIIKEKLCKVKDHIKKEMKHKVVDKELEESFSDIESRMCETAETTYSKFAMYTATNIFSIPDHVLLPEDGNQNQTKRLTKAEFDATEQQFKKDCQNVINLKIQTVKLDHRIRNLEKILDRQTQVKKKFLELKEISEMTEQAENEANKLEGKFKLSKPVFEQIENNLNLNSSCAYKKQKLDLYASILK